ncbi:TRAP transporter substrate-binding protein [Grimontia marina]|uniref:2,3-diketo-L-gulonate-binding periplasmic protein YiaO n=1 Tax=Grimontia marina TaxID=646534 RepID=A0A128F9H4_9GAMM|nr:TRAP transporter substrate-binding protein [Grimontia marina]CZF83004.1 2,3-diketo-L-gulonate-binding periplasmic protein YiaO precursor [Grimontia marina]
MKMRFKKLFALSLMYLSSSAISAEPNPYDWRSVPKSGDQIVMKLGHSVNMEWSSQTVALKRFAELVSVYSNNQIRAEIYPGAQLGGEREMVQQARQGVLQGTIPAVNNLAALAPSLNVLVLPYLSTSTDESNYLLDNITPTLNPRVIKEAGVRIVGWENTGWRAFFYKSDSPITKPEDLAKLKMRVPPNPIMLGTYKAWGGNPTPIAWKELYSALQQGVVEGGDNPVTDVIGMKFHEVINHMTRFHYTILTHPIVVSERWFQKLSPQHQEAVLRAGKETTDYVRWWQPLDEANWWKQAEDAGVTITTIENEAEWMEKARATWPQHYEKIGPDGEELAGTALSILASYPNK